MTKSFLRLALSALAIAFGTAAANAHPHVWVTVTSQIVYAPDGTATGVRYAWQFDDMFSTFATQGIEAKKKGEFTREELAPLAEVNITSMKEFDYFSYAKGNAKKLTFGTPTDYFLEFGNSMLTLHFTLPFKTPVKAQNLDIEIFDPAYYVDFSFGEKDPVTLVKAPATCKATITKPGDSNAAPQRLSEAAAAQAAAENFGAQFASRISVKCP